MRRADGDRAQERSARLAMPETRRPNNSQLHISLPSIRDIPGILQMPLRPVGTNVARVPPCVPFYHLSFAHADLYLNSVASQHQSQHTERRVFGYSAAPEGGRVECVHISCMKTGSNICVADVSLLRTDHLIPARTRSAPLSRPHHSQSTNHQPPLTCGLDSIHRCRLDKRAIL